MEENTNENTNENTIENNITYPECSNIGKTDFPMKWYKFVIYFQLFTTALSNISSALEFFNGEQYGENAALIYIYYGNALKTLDMAMGVLYVLMAVLTIVTRQKLKHFKKNATMWYFSLWILNIAITWGYILMMFSITGIWAISGVSFGITLWYIVMFILNYIYFTKRAFLFVNE